MPRYSRSLTMLAALVGVAVLAPESPAQAPKQDPKLAVPVETPALANALSKRLRALREDIDIDLPDARGAALGAIVDQSVLEVRQLQRASRTDASRAELHKLTITLDKSLDKLVIAASGLGADGYYLRRSALEINAGNEALAGLLAPVRFSPRVYVLSEQLHKGVQALRDDIGIDLPDARGKALDDAADRSLGELRQLYRGARLGAPTAVLKKEANDVNKYLSKIAQDTKAVGSEGYYLNRSAEQLLAVGIELEGLLKGP